jgi:hypothetical protein
MNRERLASFVHISGKMSDIYYEDETKVFYVQYKQDLGDMGMIEYFDSESAAELAAKKYAFGE